MKKYLILLLLIVIIFLVACTPQDNNSNGVFCTEEAMLCLNGSSVSRDPNNNCEFRECPGTGDGEITPETIEGYQGELLAGSTTPYIRYNKIDYDKALTEGKVVYLYFYATWCPVCKEEHPSILAAFDEMNYDNVVGFEVHYNDDESTQEDEDLARELGIPYQHTTVIFDENNNEAFRSLSAISKDEIKEEIAKLV